MFKQCRLFFFLNLLFSLQAFSIVVDPIEMDLNDVYQQKTTIAVSKIQAAMRFQLSVPAIIQNSKRNINDALQNDIRSLPLTLYAVTVAAYPNANSVWAKNLDLSMEKCLIVLAPNGYLASPLLRDSILMHEAFHCFQFNIAPTMQDAVNRAPWVLEGTAMFVGEDLVPQTTEIGSTYFIQYTRNVKNIFQRDYDAYPFFLHLKIEGAPVYELFQKFFVGGSDNEKLWRDIVTTVPHRALMTWAASFAYKPEWGRDWDLKTRDYYPSHPNLPALTDFPSTNVYTNSLPLVGQGEMGLPRHDKVYLEPNKILKLSVENGVAAIFYRTEDSPNGRTFYLEENKNVQFCYGPDCDCPEFLGSVHTIKVSDEKIFVASVSTQRNHIVHFDEGIKTCCNNEGGFDSRMIGTWKTSTDKLLNIWGSYPYSGGVKENHGTGAIEFEIGRRGEIIKKYKDVHFTSVVTKGKDVSTLDFKMFYEVSGCMTTRAIDADKGWLFLTDFTDQVEWVTETRPNKNGPLITRHNGGEWFQSSFCAGPGTVANPCSSTYYFEGDLLRFTGGVSNNAYSDLVRVR
jgi:hypothetical protein